jgi:hypothetical protein
MDDLKNTLIFLLFCVPFAIWKWVEIIIWFVKHIRIIVL